MMNKWISIAFSNIGKRESNQDFKYNGNIKAKRRQFEILLVCDGVGGRPFGKECSHEVGKEIVKTVESYLLKRKSKKTIKESDSIKIKHLLSKLPLLKAPTESRTTATLMIIDKKENKKGYSCITVWAGDSRAYFIEQEKEPLQVSSDQYNSEGHLSVVYSGDGKLIGELGVKYFTSKRPILYCVATDGMNSKLNHLFKFYIACVGNHVASDKEYEIQSTKFLSEIISDNYSSAMLYHKTSYWVLSNTLKLI